MGSPPPIALPPVTANYANTLQPVKAGAPPTTSEYTYTRATDGKVRVDSGTMSVITNPATAQTILLDHVKKTASIQPTPPPAPTAPPPPGMPPMPGMAPPKLPGAPAVPPVEDLGKRLFQGHEVVGQKFVTQPPPLPKPPAFQMPDAAKLAAMPIPGAPKPPQVPGAPPLPGAPAMQIPGMPKPPALTIPGLPKPPQMPGAPAVPAVPPMPGAPPPPTTPQPPITTEVWTSPKLAVPMIAKISGGFGQITQVCKSAVPGEPHPSAFQIPPGYKMI